MYRWVRAMIVGVAVLAMPGDAANACVAFGLGKLGACLGNACTPTTHCRQQKGKITVFGVEVQQDYCDCTTPGKVSLPPPPAPVTVNVTYETKDAPKNEFLVNIIVEIKDVTDYPGDPIETAPLTISGTLVKDGDAVQDNGDYLARFLPDGTVTFEVGTLFQGEISTVTYVETSLNRFVGISVENLVPGPDAGTSAYVTDMFAQTDLIGWAVGGEAPFSFRSAIQNETSQAPTAMPGFAGWIVQTGACCHDDGICDELSAADCATVGGSYKGDGTICANVICSACCLTDDTCNGELTKEECVAAGGTSYAAPATCAEIAGKGGCAADIPAVTSWGLAVMLLLVAAAGTIVIRRTRALP